MSRTLCLLLLALVALGAARSSSVDRQGWGDVVKFASVDVLIDPQGAPLVAWQARIHDPAGLWKVVSIEGGEDPAFAEPPHYDPAMMVKGELRIAAYHTAGSGPNTRTRVARLHLACDGGAPLDLVGTLEVAASEGGPIAGAQLELAP